MAGKSSTVRVAIVGDNSSLNRSLKDSQSKLSKFGKAIGKVAIAGGLLVGAAAAYAAVNFAEAAVEDQKAAALLADALRKATGATDAQIASTEEWISKQGVLLGVTDDELRPALARLAGATGDIGEAQKLASLAMDVSAARGKDLSAVTEALAKAQQGNLSGLSRLGVATKDAAGKTKSLKDITADLSKLYGGAATAAANTAAGKYERVKLQLGEMSEDIGAKLLPVITEFGDWLLKTGIPAAEDFADAAGKKLGPAIEDLTEWFKDNKDELVDLGGQITDVLIPAVETLGGLVGDLVGFFSDLPDPVRKVGIEAAIAAAAFYKFGPAITSVTRSMSTGITKAKQFGAEMTYAETRGAALSSGLGKLGNAAKGLAGAAGLGLLIDSARQTDNAMGALETTAGGAAIGFSVGGPLGAALGGIAGLAFGAGKAFLDGKSDVEKFRDSLGKKLVAHVDSSAVRDLLELLAKAHGNYRLIAADAAQQAAENAVGGASKLADVSSITGLRKDTIGAAFANDPQAIKLVSAAMEELNGQIASGKTLLDDFAGTSIDILPNELADLQGAYDSGLISQSQLTEGVKLFNATQADGITSGKEYNQILEFNAGIVDSVTEKSKQYQAVLQSLTDLTGDRTAALDLLNQNEAEGAKLLGITVEQLHKLPPKVITDIDLNGAPETNQQAIGLIAKFGKLLKFKDIRTIVSAPGVDLTRGQIEKLTTKYKLTPKQVKTLLKLEGVKDATKGADNVKKAVKGAADTKPDFSNFRSGTNKFFSDMQPVASSGGKKVGKAAKEGVRQGAGKPDLDPFKRGVQSELGNIKGTASSGGSEIGSSAKSGFNNGFAGAIASWSAQVRAAVAAAINAGKSEAKAHSPSKETEQLGQDMSDGLVVGMKKNKHHHQDAGAGMVDDTLAGMIKRLKEIGIKSTEAFIAGLAQGSEGITASLGILDKGVDKNLNAQLKDRQRAIKEKFGKGQGKAEEKALAQLDKHWSKHTKKVQKGLKDERAALVANGVAQDALNAKLDAESEKLRGLQDDANAYAASITASFEATGDVTALGKMEDGTVSATKLIDEMKQAVIKAQEFASNIRKLQALNLNDAALQQLLAAGPEAAGATAAALAEGGADTVTQINILQSQLTTAGASLGGSMANEFYGAGINAQQALVNGLISDAAKLDAAAVTLASTLVKAVKKALKIKSPSKVFEGIGDQVTKGLGVGLDNVYVRKQGEEMAQALTSGFGTPVMTAAGTGTTAAANAAGLGTDPIRVEVTLTAQQVSQLERGRAIQLDLDAYAAAGGRRRS